MGKREQRVEGRRPRRGSSPWRPRRRPSWLRYVCSGRCCEERGIHRRVRVRRVLKKRSSVWRHRSLPPFVRVTRPRRRPERPAEGPLNARSSSRCPRRRRRLYFIRRHARVSRRPSRASTGTVLAELETVNCCMPRRVEAEVLAPAKRSRCVEHRHGRRAPMVGKTRAMFVRQPGARRRASWSPRPSATSPGARSDRRRRREGRRRRSGRPVLTSSRIRSGWSDTTETAPEVPRPEGARPRRSRRSSAGGRDSA